MATTMEQRAKFRELRTSGISRDEAQTQAYGNITPVVLPTQTPDVNSDANRIARLQASGRTETADIIKANTTPVAPTPATPPVVPTTEVTGVDGQKFTQAPVDPNTGLSTPQQPAITPVAPAPTTEVNPPSTNPVAPTTTAPKTPTVDYTQAQGREQEIMTNLEKFKTQNMTPEQIKNASGYAQATPEKKAIIDGFLNPAKQDSGTIFNTLKMGGSVPASNTPEYRQAQARYNTFRKYTTYDVASLSTAMQGGDLLMGTQAYTDLTSDPAMLAKLQRARAFTNGEVDIVKTGEKMGAYVMSNNPTVAQALSDGSMSQEEYNSLTNNAEVETQAKVVSEKKADYDEYKRQLENISDEVDLEFEGKEVTDSFKSAIKANRDKAIRRLFNSASDEYQNASGLYTELKNSSTQLLALNMEQYKTQQANNAQIASEQRQIQSQKDMLTYKSEFEKKQAQEALNDPATAIQTAIDEYKKIGIPFTSTVQSRLAEFNASGKSLPDYLTQMRENIQQSPAYQKYQSLQNGQLSDAQKVASSQSFDLKKMGMEQDFQMKIAQAKNIADNKWTKLDDGMYQDSNGNVVTADEMKSAKIMNNSYINKQVGEEGGECGFYASRGTGMNATPGGNSKEARVQAFSDKTPEVGGMAFFGGSGYDKTYGHIAIVTGVNIENGTVNVKDSNYANDKKVQERTVPASSITGYYNNTPLASSLKGVAQGTGTQGTQANKQFKPESVPQYSSYLSSGKIGTNSEELKAITAEFGSIENFKKQAEAYNNSPDGPRQQELNKVNKLRDKWTNIISKDNSEALSNSVGSVTTAFSPWTKKDKDGYLAEVQNLISGKTLQELINAKADGATFGALSNEELRMLQSSSTELAQLAEYEDDGTTIKSFKGSEEGFKKKVEALVKEYENLIAKKQRQMGDTEQQPVQPQDNTNTGGVTTYNYNGQTVTLNGGY